MANRVSWALAIGFSSFVLLGAAGAAADDYAPTHAERHSVVCDQLNDDTQVASAGFLECSVHRVSETYHHQSMARVLSRARAQED